MKGFDGCRVLLADDDEISREIAAEIVRNLGADCEFAADGDALLARLADAGVPLSVELERVRTHAGNIAGVEIPVYDGVDLRRAEVDLFATPEWVDDAAAAAAALIGVRAERDVAAEQVRLIAEELRTTSQRVNLFEKVKIPECRENIRVINVAIGDEQTSAVARAKIAKSRGAGG